LTGRPYGKPEPRPANCFIQFSDIDGQSNCGYEPNIYIKFLGGFLPEERKWKTTILQKTSQPHWDKTDPFPIIYPELEYVRSLHAVLVFMDDVVGNNKPLGQAIVGLSEACGDKPAKFDVDIFHFGLVNGRVSGFVHVTGLTSVSEKIGVFS
jgi:hypothetical protein